MRDVELDPGLSWDDFPWISLGMLHRVDIAKFPDALRASHWRFTRPRPYVILPHSAGRQPLHYYLYELIFGAAQTRLRRNATCAIPNCINPFHWSPSETASAIPVPPQQGATPQATDAVSDLEPSDEEMLRNAIERQVFVVGNTSITALTNMFEGLFTREDIERIVNSDPLLKQDTTP